MVSCSGFLVCQAGGRGLLRGMRISGGLARGIQLQVPKGDAVRPATDSLRQAVFSSLGTVIPDATFVDLFAGSGAYGLEALSRGASSGAWVEKHARTAGMLKQNVVAVCRSLGRSQNGLETICDDVLSGRWLASARSVDVVFADPPYPIAEQVAWRLFELIDAQWESGWPGLVVFEHPGELELAPPGWRVRKRIGRGTRQPCVSMLERAPGPPESA